MNLQQLYTLAFGEAPPPAFTTERKYDKTNNLSRFERYFNRPLFSPVFINCIAVPYAIVSVTLATPALQGATTEQPDFVRLEDLRFTVKAVLPPDVAVSPEPTALQALLCKDALLSFRCYLTDAMECGPFEQTVKVEACNWMEPGAGQGAAFEATFCADTALTLNLS